MGYQNALKRHRRTCAPKRAFAGRRDALDALYAYVRTCGAWPGGLKVYRCKACGWWHFGHHGHRGR